MVDSSNRPPEPARLLSTTKAPTPVAVAFREFTWLLFLAPAAFTARSWSLIRPAQSCELPQYLHVTVFTGASTRQ